MFPFILIVSSLGKLAGNRLRIWALLVLHIISFAEYVKLFLMYLERMVAIFGIPFNLTCGSPVRLSFFHWCSDHDVLALYVNFFNGIMPRCIYDLFIWNYIFISSRSLRKQQKILGKNYFRSGNISLHWKRTK